LFTNCILSPNCRLTKDSNLLTHKKTGNNLTFVGVFVYIYQFSGSIFVLLLNIDLFHVFAATLFPVNCPPDILYSLTPKIQLFLAGSSCLLSNPYTQSYKIGIIHCRHVNVPPDLFFSSSASVLLQPLDTVAVPPVHSSFVYFRFNICASKKLARVSIASSFFFSFFYNRKYSSILYVFQLIYQNSKFSN